MCFSPGFRGGRSGCCGNGEIFTEIMGKIIFLFLIGIAGCRQSGMPYTVEGHLLQKEGWVWLLDGEDTLAGAELKDGAFLLRGELQQQTGGADQLFRAVKPCKYG